MKKLIKEPLIHFLLLGGALFLLFQLVNPQKGEPGAKEIVITSGIQEQLAAQYESVWGRPPSSQELEGLEAAYIREEILFREALAMGLEEGDGVIRQRLVEKMEFVAGETGDFPVPTNAELQAFLDAHPDRFQMDARTSFKQVFFDPDQHEGAPSGTILLALAQLTGKGADADLSQWGEGGMFGESFGDFLQQDVIALFGEEFGEELMKAPEGIWYGPVSSVFGEHLIYVTGRERGQNPTLGEVREAVSNAWTAEQLTRSREAWFEEVKSGYTIIREEGE